jgi:plastocyanin
LELKEVLSDATIKSFRNVLAQTPESPTKSSVKYSKRPFAIWVLSLGLMFSGLDLLYGISQDLPKLSSSSDPLLDIMVLFIALCFVSAIGSLLQKTWGYIIAMLVSLGFIIGANVLNAWIPTLLNPHDLNTFIVADTIVPVLVLVAILSIMCFVNRKKGVGQKKYLASWRTLTGALTIAIIVLAIAGAIVGASFSSSASSTNSSVSVSLVNGAFNPSSTQHFVPSTITVVIGVNNTVIWTNNDYTIHTVTSDSSIFDSGLLNNGNSWSYTFTTAGTYSYHCAIHPYMNGTVTVIA